MSYARNVICCSICSDIHTYSPTVRQHQLFNSDRRDCDGNHEFDEPSTSSRTVYAIFEKTCQSSPKPGVVHKSWTALSLFLIMP